MIIYKMQNSHNGKIYIGQTTRTIEERTKEHRCHANLIIDKAIRKYGLAAFDIAVIDQADTVDELNDKEKYWISHYKCILPHGYNQCEGGDNTAGYKHKTASKRKMSQSHKALDKTGARNPFYGCKHSEETRHRMIEAWKSKDFTDEWKQKIRDAHPTRQVLNIDTGEVFNSIKEAAIQYRIKDTHITRVCRGRRKSCGGYRWTYLEDRAVT